MFNWIREHENQDLYIEGIAICTNQTDSVLEYDGCVLEISDLLINDTPIILTSDNCRGYLTILQDFRKVQEILEAIAGYSDGRYDWDYATN